MALITGPVAVTGLPKLVQPVEQRLALYCNWYFWPVSPLHVKVHAVPFRVMDRNAGGTVKRKIVPGLYPEPAPSQAI